MGLVYANEFDPDAAHWLSCLPIQLDKIDSRSIKEVSVNDIQDYTQCHFFAGIGGWPLALELAGWPADAPVWTGSCPCQPFSQAGKRKGFNDERHLWPEFLRLIAECQPPTIFGEQVASNAGRAWLTVVRADLEALGYAVGAADLCAAGVGSPQIRQRLYWVAKSASTGLEKRQCGPARPKQSAAERSGDAGGMANAYGRESGNGDVQRSGEHRQQQATSGDGGWGKSAGLRGGRRIRRESSESREDGRRLPAGPGFWSDVEWIYCRDGQWRPVKSGGRVLAHGVSGRVAQLRGLGNAIVPQVAATFVEAVMEILGIEQGEWT